MGKKVKKINKVQYDVRVYLQDDGSSYRLRYWNKHTRKYIKHLEKRFYAKSLSEAILIKDAEQADERFINYVERKNIDTDFIQFFDDLIASKRNAGTRAYYLQSLAKFKEFAGSQIPFTEITKELIENFKVFLLRTVMQNTANAFFAAFAHGIRSAEEKGFIRHLFFKRIPQSQVEKDYLTKAEISRIIQIPWHNRLKEAFIIECLAAFSYNELHRLRWKDINYDDGSITCKRQKTGQIITNPVDKKILLMLGDQGRSTDLVFPELTTLKRYNANIKRIVSKAGITKNISSHCGRGSCIIALIGGSGGAYSAQSFAGHKDIKTTLRYARFTPELKRKAGNDLMEGIVIPKSK